MNKLLITILFTFLFCQTSFVSALDDFQNKQLPAIKCAPRLQQNLNKIQKIPEARALIASIQKEGPIQIVNKNTGLSNQFGAFWDPDQRVICIALSSHSTEGAVIGSLLFELHNAAITSKFNRLDELVMTGKINKATYIESMEYLEYQNSLEAVKIAEKGIQMGILPRSARLPTYSSFKEHFSEQKRSGHSACFARIYDELRRGRFY